MWQNILRNGHHTTNVYSSPLIHFLEKQLVTDGNLFPRKHYSVELEKRKGQLVGSSAEKWGKCKCLALEMDGNCKMRWELACNMCYALLFVGQTPYYIRGGWLEFHCLIVLIKCSYTGLWVEREHHKREECFKLYWTFLSRFSNAQCVVVVVVFVGFFFFFFASLKKKKKTFSFTGEK